MIKKYGLLGLCMAFSLYTSAQSVLKQGKWHADLHRHDGHSIPFIMDIQYQNGKYTPYIVNGTERIKTEDIVMTKDSAIIRMPVFESYFRVKIVNKDSLNGVWVQAGEVKDILIPFTAASGGSRFTVPEAIAPQQLQGKWSIEITRPNQTKRPAIGEIIQTGSQLKGTVLTPSGDYRYLNGVQSKDSLFLSTFDGKHAILLTAKIDSARLTGNLYNSDSPFESLVAVKDANAVLKDAGTAVKNGSDGKVNFSLKDLQGNTVSLQSDRYKGKVVILQLMGSWCPNCMDETAFLSDYYNHNKNRGVEIIALAYELSTDAVRSKKSIEKFKNQFNVQYPILNTGVTASDPQRADKTLPQLTAIKSFPTTLILDKNGVISHITTTFYGPGAGEYHLKYKQDLEKSISTLLEQRL